MTEPNLDTIQLQGWLQRMQAGDLAARDALVRAVCDRLEHLSRKMLRRYPNVKRFADTDDVLQSSLMRLLRTLQQMPPPESTAHFFNLAAAHVRRELLDLARHFSARCRQGAPADLADHDPEDDRPASDFGDLEQWCAFHEAVEQLPAEQREVVGLIFYHGWQQKDVAQLFGTTERTVRRRWREAMLTLHRHLHTEDLEG
jgi:RNA polymerase sigma factor (sigma-70 family)